MFESKGSPMSKLSLFTLFLGSSLLLNCAANTFQQPPIIKKAIRQSLIGSEAGVDDLEQFIKDNPDDAKIARHMLYAGELRRLQGDYKEARNWFNKIVEEFPTADEKNVARLGMAVIDYDSGKSDQIKVLRTIEENAAFTPDSLNADRYLSLYLEEDPEGDIAQRYATKSRLYAISHPKTQSRLEAILPSQDNTEDLETVENTDTEPEKNLNPTEMLEAALSEKNWDEAIAISEEFLTQFPDSEYVSFVQASLDRANTQDPFQLTKVAILLPMTGKYAPAAKAIQQSLEFSNAGRVNLQFYDSGWVEEAIEKPEFEKDKEGHLVDQEAFDAWQEKEAESKKSLQLTIDAKINELIKKIVTEDGCSLIIGPLLKEVAPPAAKAAMDYQIPLISLSKSDDVLKHGEFIYRISIPVNQQVTALVDHAMDQRSWTTFVAMVPDNEYGKTALELFQAEVEKKGGQVLRSVFYDPKATSFLNEARTLGLKSENRPTERQLEKDPTLDHPTMDFDAIFIPDNHRRLPSVASSLAFEEFSIGSFRINRHAEPTHAIGLNGWNNPSVTDSQYLANGIFVDAYWVNSSNETVQNFVKTYQETNKRAPNMYDALSQDAMNLAFEIISTQPSSRTELNTKIPTVVLSKPVTGGTKFNEKRDLDRTLSIFVIKKNGIREWQAPPEDGKD